jgi:hypothetical protein
MTIPLLLLTCLALSPWLLQFSRYIVSRPEAISTTAWMVTSNVAFLFIAPLLKGFISGESFVGHDHAASLIAAVTITFWWCFAAVYRLLSGRQRTSSPDGPHGLPTAVGVIKSATLSSTAIGAFLAFVPLLLIKLWLLKSRGLGVSGSGTLEVMLGLPYYVVIIMQLTNAAMMAFTAVFAYQFFSKATHLAKPLAGLGLVVNVIFALLAGRREILYTGLLAAWGLTWSGRRRGALAVVLVAIFAWFTLVVFSPIFLRARAIYRDRNSPGVVAAFRIAIAQGESGDERMLQENAENISQRTNTYLFWLEMYDRFEDRSLGGTLLLQTVAMTLPRAVAGMTKYSWGANEEQVLGTKDIANNVCLTSYIDLGFVGPFVYGIVVAVVFFLMDLNSVFVGRGNRFLALMAVSASFSFLLSPEADAKAYLTTFRNNLVLSVIALAAVYVFGRRPADFRGIVRSSQPPLNRPVRSVLSAPA